MTRFATQAIPYPAARDHGPRGRWPTLAVNRHMAEGRNVAQYLSRDPLRGVSVHLRIGVALTDVHLARVSGPANASALRTRHLRRGRPALSSDRAMPSFRQGLFDAVCPASTARNGFRSCRAAARVVPLTEWVRAPMMRCRGGATPA